MTNEELAAIEARAAAGIKIALKGFGLPPDAYEALRDDVPALVADLRRLRELARDVFTVCYDAGAYINGAYVSTCRDCLAVIGPADALPTWTTPPHEPDCLVAALAAALEGEGGEQ